MIQRQITRIRTLVALWRVLGTIVLGEAIGALLGLVPLLPTGWSVDRWWGMAAGTLIGFMVGTAWHLGAQRAERGLSRLFIGSLLLALLLAAVAIDKQNWARMAQLQNDRLQSIAVFKRAGGQPLVILEDPVVLAAFVDGIADAVPHLPNHPHYSATWFVVVEGTQTYQFELHLNSKFPQSVIGETVKHQGSTTSYQLTFQRDGLRPWVEHYLIQAADARSGR